MTLMDAYCQIIAARKLQTEWDALCVWSELPQTARDLCIVDAGGDGYYLDLTRLGARLGAFPPPEDPAWRLPLGATPEAATQSLERAFTDLAPLLAELTDRAAPPRPRHRAAPDDRADLRPGPPVR